MIESQATLPNAPPALPAAAPPAMRADAGGTEPPAASAGRTQPTARSEREQAMGTDPAVPPAERDREAETPPFAAILAAAADAPPVGPGNRAPSAADMGADMGVDMGANIGADMAGNVPKPPERRAPGAPVLWQAGFAGGARPLDTLAGGQMAVAGSDAPAPAGNLVAGDPPFAAGTTPQQAMPEPAPAALQETGTVEAAGDGSPRSRPRSQTDRPAGTDAPAGAEQAGPDPSPEGRKPAGDATELAGDPADTAGEASAQSQTSSKGRDKADRDAARAAPAPGPGLAGGAQGGAKPASGSEPGSDMASSASGGPGAEAPAPVREAATPTMPEGLPADPGGPDGAGASAPRDIRDLIASATGGAAGGALSLPGGEMPVAAAWSAGSESRIAHSVTAQIAQAVRLGDWAPAPLQAPGGGAAFPVSLRTDPVIELTLQPAELGRLRITLDDAGEMLRLHVSADRPETLDLLRRHADVLRQEFAALGGRHADLHFSAGASGGGRESPTWTDPGPQSPDGASIDGPERPIAHTRPGGPPAGAREGLDLRL